MHKNSYQVLLVFLVLFLLCIPATALEMADFEDILNTAPVQEDYPGAGAIILKNNLVCDFTRVPYTYRFDNIYKIFDKRGIDNFAEARIQFDKERERIEIIYAYTIKSDGTVIEVEDNSIHEITPAELSEAKIYSNVKELVINFPGVEADAIIVYSYVIEEIEPLICDHFWQNKMFAYIEPVKESTLEIKVPEEKELYYRIVRGNIEPVVEKKDGYRKYVWEKKDIPAVPVETGMLSLADIVPMVKVSSFANWQEFSEWFSGLITDQYKINDLMYKKLEELTADLETDEEKIKAVYNYVSMNIRYVGLEFGIDGYKPHNAVETFENKYGDCKDKATLLIAFLSAIGVRAEPVLINVLEHPGLEVVSPGEFNHMIVYLPNKDLYLDPTIDLTMYGDLPSADQGKKVVLPLANWVLETPVFSAENNREFFKQKVKLFEDGSARINVIWFADGAFDSVNKAIFASLNEQQQELQLKMLMNYFFPGNEIENYSFTGIDGLENNFRIELELLMQNYFQTMGNLLSIKTFRVPASFSQIVGSSERENAIYMGFNMNVGRDIEIELPEGFVVNYIPENIRIENETGLLEANFQQKGQKIELYLDLKTSKHIIEVDQYQNLKDLLDSTTEVMNQQILLQKN